MRSRLANDIHYGLSSYVWTENLGRAHRVAAAVEAGMCFVNSQNVRDLRQPFGGTKASGTGREGGTWSYEVFCEPKNVAVSLGTHHIPHWGRMRTVRRLRHPGLDPGSTWARQHGCRIESGMTASGDGDCHHGQARARRQDHARSVDVPVGVPRPATRAAAKPPSTATRKSTVAAARSAWTPSSCSTCTGRSTASTTSTADRSSKGSTPATSCPTSSRTCPTPTRATRRWAT